MKDRFAEIILSSFLVVLISVVGFYSNSQIMLLREAVASVQAVQVELARRGEWMEWVTAEIIDLNTQTSDRYTKREAEKDIAYTLASVHRVELTSNKNRDGFIELSKDIVAIKQSIKELKPETVKEVQ